MENERGLVFKVATEPWEFEQVHRLNYTTFVEEIPQHTPNPNKACPSRGTGWRTRHGCSWWRDASR